MSMDVGENKARNEIADMLGELDTSYLSDADAARFWELVAMEVEDRRRDMGDRSDRAAR